MADVIDDVKIAELAEKTSISDTDIFVIDNIVTTFKIKFLTIAEYVRNKLIDSTFNQSSTKAPTGQALYDYYCLTVVNGKLCVTYEEN